MKLFIQLGWFFLREWRQYCGAVTLLIVIALLQLVPPHLVGLIIDHVVKGDINQQRLLLWLGIILFLALIVYVLRYLWRILLFSAAYKLAIELRASLYHLFSRQLPSFYLRYRTGDLMTRATNDVDCVVFAVGEGVLMLVDSLVMGCSVILVMSVQISWPLTLFALLPMPIMTLLLKKDGEKLHQYFRIAQAAFSTLNNQAQENLTSIRMIKALGLEQRQAARFTTVAVEVSNKNMMVARVDARFDPTIYLTVGLSNLLAVSGGSWLVMRNLMTLGELTSFIMYLGLMIWPMLALAWMFNIVERGSASYSRIRQTLEEVVNLEDGNLPLPPEPGILQVAIQHFHYPDSKTTALANISVTLLPGQILGICGPTGAGKSTLLALILRHFAIQQGAIYFHNVPLTSLASDQWRSRLAVVEQTPFLFSDSIANNIALGRPNASRQQIEMAAQLACLHDDIIRLPDQYYTEIGERGVILSGGQKQRLAIARALLLEAEIIILDDALSAVDSYTEHHILNNLRTCGNDCTVIIATHRLSTLIDANEILVLKQGNILQRGNHYCLMRQSGWYADMYHYQQLATADNIERQFIRQDNRNE